MEHTPPKFVLLGDSVVNRDEVNTVYPYADDCVKVEFCKGSFRIATGITVEGALSLLNGAAF